MTEEQKARLEALQKEHGRIAHTVLDDGTMLAFRSPTLDEWEDFQEALSGTKRKGATYRELAQRTCVEPGVDALKKLFAQYPALSVAIAGTLSELAGSEIEVTIKKG